MRVLYNFFFCSYTFITIHILRSPTFKFIASTVVDIHVPLFLRIWTINIELHNLQIYILGDSLQIGTPSVDWTAQSIDCYPIYSGHPRECHFERHSPPSLKKRIAYCTIKYQTSAHGHFTIHSPNSLGDPYLMNEFKNSNIWHVTFKAVP